MALAFSIHCASVFYTETYGEAAAIVDTGFHWLPRTPKGLGDILAYMFPVIALARYYLQGDWGQIYCFLKQCSTLMIMRAVATASTMLPPAEPCVPDVLTVFHGGCYDKVFSGHVAYQTLAALHLRGSVPDGILLALVLMESVLLIGSREHYTVDILIAIYLAKLLDASGRGSHG